MSQIDGVGTGGAKMVLLRGSAGDGDYADGWRCKGGELDVGGISDDVCSGCDADGDMLVEM
ncbi:hypothetical protein C5167_031914 [Papaver somniferum]|uniref:Uncharacterized protein n=1 Tax=Papaver somniferum TaxID=3469 RepID=A0A4Y7K5U1_PAPSO|nr:hypothetical protein C5167_031914 [Papaver somniferum]